MLASPLPIFCVDKAKYPIAVDLLAPVSAVKAFLPIAILKLPVVKASPACPPKIVLEVPVVRLSQLPYTTAVLNALSPAFRFNKE